MGTHSEEGFEFGDEIATPPRHFRDLTRKEKAEVLESHMFLKEKRSIEIKGQTVAGRNKKRDFVSKEDAISPTVATESVLPTFLIEAQ